MLMHLISLWNREIKQSFLVGTEEQWAFAEGLEEVSGGSLILNNN